MHEKGAPGPDSGGREPTARAGRTKRADRADVSTGSKVKGACQMALGTAVAVTGVPLCVLPGPGLAAIAGGAALASKGQRTFTGREPNKVERKLDAAAEKMGQAAKREASKAARAAAHQAPIVAGKVARATARGTVKVARATGRVAAKGAKAAAERIRRRS